MFTLIPVKYVGYTVVSGLVYAEYWRCWFGVKYAIKRGLCVGGARSFTAEELTVVRRY